MGVLSKRLILVMFLICRASIGMTQESENPCQSIRFHTVEAMEPQGAFGLETPELYPEITVRNSFYREIRISGRPELQTSVLTPAQHRPHPAWGRDVPSHHYFFPNDRMKLWELCTLAQKKNIRELSIVCKGDSESPDVIKAECFFSTQVGGNDLELYEQRRWGRKTRHSSTVDYFDRGRYTALKQVATRQDLYGPAIRDAVNSIVQIENIDYNAPEYRYRREMRYLSQAWGDGDITISPQMAACIGKIPFEDFKKWVDWDRKRFGDKPISVRKANEIAESIIFFIIYVLPFLL